ncbi:hypothetical protein L596_013098 [Steinernema carpocapsae]|uniref:Uncharacterized protein n=1 Tax=Steinernema carpocapsae TaxID=34508 RepID=A0A4U5NZN3_STECR|nr:hypothetical protein L596_013098 [Steinernema carpocapsae]
MADVSGAPMSVLRRNVRFGTALMPTFVKDTLAEIPGVAFTSPQMNPLDGYDLFPETRLKPMDNLPEKFKLPSVTMINSCVQDNEALYRWQMMMVQQMGAALFRRHSLASEGWI